MLKIKIANQTVSYQDDVFIVAEAGVNHNGRLDLALKLIDVAADAGATAIKFQTFKASEVVLKNADMAVYQKKNLKSNQTQLVMLKKLELKEKFYVPLINYCRKRKIIFLSAAHGGFASVDFLQNLRLPAFKFGSGDLTNFPVLANAAKFYKPMILATGMATLKEIKEAVTCITKAGNNKIILLHATTNYPCPLNEVNLLAMRTMMQYFGYPIGYSDHTLGIETSCAAVALGACMIEKHFTLDKKMPGPDHRSSANPGELREMIQQIKKIKILLGSAVKKPNPSEKQMMKMVRKSVVSILPIDLGERFTAKNIGIKRPGTGLHPKYFYDIIGKKAKRNIKADELINKRDYV